MNEMPGTDPFHGLEAAAEVLRSTGADLGRCDVTSMDTSGGIAFARDTLRDVGEALAEVSGLVGELAGVREVPWASAARPALYRARCRVEEARWGIGVLADERNRGSTRPGLPADEVSALSKAMAAVKGELAGTRWRMPPAGLGQGEAVRLMKVVCRIMAVLLDVVGVVNDASMADGECEVRVETVRDLVQAARMELAMAAWDAERSADGPGGEVWMLRDVRRHVVALGGSNVDSDVVAAAGLGEWLDEVNGARRLSVAADAVRALDAIVVSVQIAVDARWACHGDQVSSARQALARAATVLGFVRMVRVAPMTVGAMHPSLVRWERPVFALAGVAAVGSAVAYQYAAGRVSGAEIGTWLGEVAVAVRAIAPSVAAIGACVRSGEVASMLSQVTAALMTAYAELEAHAAWVSSRD